jgi:hypothetical protein
MYFGLVEATGSCVTYIVGLAVSRRAGMSALAGWSKWLSSAAAFLRADRQGYVPGMADREQSWKHFHHSDNGRRAL